MKFNERRLFGVEIEILVPPSNSLPREANQWVSELADELTDQGVECRFEDYNHDTRRYWKIIFDSTCGYELVSPPMRGRDGLRQIEIVCEVLNFLGVRVNRRCGVHVHHDVGDFRIEQFKRLVLFYDRFEEVIDSLMPPSRRGNNNSFCRPVSRVVRLDRIRQASRLIDLDNTTFSRYGKLNLESYQRYGTIEFRQHSGTTSSEKIVNWVILTGTIIDRMFTTIKKATPEKNTWSDFQTVMGMYGSWVEDDLSKQAVTFYRKRRKELAR